LAKQNIVIVEDHQSATEKLKDQKKPTVTIYTEGYDKINET